MRLFGEVLGHRDRDYILFAVGETFLTRCEVSGNGVFKDVKKKVSFLLVFEEQFIHRWCVWIRFIRTREKKIIFHNLLQLSIFGEEWGNSKSTY